MGQAMAGRLLAANWLLTVHNRTPARAEGLRANGAAWAASPADLASQADIVLTSLTDDRAVEHTFLGADGLLAGAVTGTLFVEMSTIRPSTIHRLRPLVEARGARLLDAPVSGTLEPARQGQLVAMVGGTETDLARARPVLEVLTRRIVHMGPSGAGTTMKLVLNMPMAIFWAGLGEAMAMGRQFGLDMAQMLDVYLDSPVALPALRGKVTGVRKDLLAMVASAQDAGVPAATGSAALALFAAATAAGYGERDLAFLIEYVIEMARQSAGPVDANATPSS
jgi:3-hydroxyisobutyrate dehydrogenase-like beta-hydroxyacid dehydrogenase